MDWKAKWIRPAADPGDVCPLFRREFALARPVAQARLYITAMGVYSAEINGARVGGFILAPGWTAYKKRLQYQEYDVTPLLSERNRLEVTVGKGWYRSKMPGWVENAELIRMQAGPAGLLAQLVVTYTDGGTEIIASDDSWTAAESPVRYSEIYDGEIFDATFEVPAGEAAVAFEGPTDTLIPQQGEEIREQERISPARFFTTPAGERVVDFGQELTGYVEIEVTAKAGEVVSLSFAEVMDKAGNFYTENYRGAKAQYQYTCREGKQSYKTRLTFYGFRYVRIDRFPGGVEKAGVEHFTGIVLHSQLRRTGWLNSSNPTLNRLFDNIVWGQKGNFLDVPTDCPQRDERLGWTGDAQVFVRTACLFFDVEKFFTKWLADMSADQLENGRVGHVIPDWLPADGGSAAWGDAAAICPWEVYLAYGNPEILRSQYDCMEKWVGFITGTTTKPNLWTGGTHFGDWLGLDAPSGSYKGSSREDFIASAFYAHSTALLIKAGKVLGKDMSKYEALHRDIVAAFRREFPTCETQTECVLAAHFGLAEDCRAVGDRLADMVKQCGVQLQTGFVGTPYLLHVLSDYGHADLAYSLLLREKYPSWLYPVTKDATTIWEHWDGIMENGDFWSADMNSFNHYAYGAVADWVYGVAAGIRPVEEAPGYERVVIAPLPDPRLDWLEAVLDTQYGRVRSCWKKQGSLWRFEIETPVEARVVVGGREHAVPAGEYLFFSGMG